MDALLYIIIGVLISSVIFWTVGGLYLVFQKPIHSCLRRKFDAFIERKYQERIEITENKEYNPTQPDLNLNPALPVTEEVETNTLEISELNKKRLRLKNFVKSETNIQLDANDQEAALTREYVEEYYRVHKKMPNLQKAIE